MHSSNQETITPQPEFSFLESDEKEILESPPQDVQLESVDPDLYNLSYTCLLIPRFPSHQLKGDLADYLPSWLQQVCISFSWRLELTTVNPDYLQWVIIVSPSTAPAQFMYHIRHETSKMVLSSFGHIRRGNLSNDFWAPGYLVVLGTRPHPEEMIKQYIKLTRRQQGLVNLL
jgi:REP element-mobilizing transposase RayT